MLCGCGEGGLPGLVARLGLWGMAFTLLGFLLTLCALTAFTYVAVRLSRLWKVRVEGRTPERVRDSGLDILDAPAPLLEDDPAPDLDAQ